MELFKKIRINIGKTILSKKVVRIKKKVYYSNFSQVKSIGIAWDASRPMEFSSLTKFYQKMHELKIEVKIFGYYPGKNLPDQYTAIRYLTCIRKDEINTFYHPVSPETKKFINNPFDILIDINFEKQFPLIYVTSLSNARFKIGLFDPESAEAPFDLMMEIKNPVDIDNYLVQIIYYLEMIKDKTVNTVDKKLIL
jgi:hypothetical protein